MTIKSNPVAIVLLSLLLGSLSCSASFDDDLDGSSEDYKRGKHQLLPPLVGGWTPSVNFPPKPSGVQLFFAVPEDHHHQHNLNTRPQLDVDDDNADDQEDRPPPAEQAPLAPRDYFPPPTIVGLLEDEGFTTLLGLLEQADPSLLSRLGSTRGNMTLFAPTNAAFAKLEPKDTQTLSNDTAGLLKSVLDYHVVPGGRIFSHVVKDDLLAETLLANRSLRMNLLFPGQEKQRKRFMASGAEVELADQRAANGVVHFLSDVIYPLPAESVMDALSDDARFVTLSRALEVAGLTAELRDNPGPFTVFAPTDEAFDRLSKESLSALLDDKEAMRALLLRHVVKGGVKLGSALVASAAEELRAENGKISVRTRKGRVWVAGQARLVDGDILADNGVVQVVDKVFMS